MTRRLIDVSVPLRNDATADPPGLQPSIEYFDHRRSVPEILPFFPGLMADDLPDGRAGRSSAFSSRLTTARISMRPGAFIPP
jgi:hypothetical protein